MTLISVGDHVRTVDQRYGDVVGRATWMPHHQVWAWDRHSLPEGSGPWVVTFVGSTFVFGYHADDLTVIERSGAR